MNDEEWLKKQVCSDTTWLIVLQWRGAEGGIGPNEVL